MDWTKKLESIAALINRYAGSLIPGVPASETKAKSSPEFKWLISLGIRAKLLCSK